MSSYQDSTTTPSAPPNGASQVGFGGGHTAGLPSLPSARPPLTPVAPVPAADALPLYRCDACGSTHPAHGARRRNNGGQNCRACQRVCRELEQVRRETMRIEMASAPRDDFAAWAAHQARAVAKSSVAWAEAMTRIGVPTQVPVRVDLAGLVAGAEVRS